MWKWSYGMQNRQHALWGEAELEKLRTLWGDGLSASRVAQEFGDGRTRNSIIGKVHALGLPARQLHTGDKRTQAQRRKDGDVVGGIRKAYASRGDDCTLSRFVKVKSPPGEHKQLPRKQWAFDGMGRRNASIEAGRSLFHERGIITPRPGVLVSGHNNVKIGRDVRKGPLRGYWIYTLTLEERRTCPRTCLHWDNCYGNNMPFAKRVDHTGRAELERAIEADIVALLRNPRRVGILVRLHALGDFPNVEYVDFWGRMLAKYDRLATYGYTAWHPGTPIGEAIVRTWRDYRNRFAVRFSDGPEMCAGATQSIKSIDQAVNSIVCPEQTGKTAACATCGLCWHTNRRIAFVEH
jgi:hypothetical protein